MRHINLKAVAFAFAGLLSIAPAVHAEEEAKLLPFREEVGNIESVQRGARDFMNYCSGCHSLKYLRYSRAGEDLQIPDDLLKKNLMFTSDKPGDTIASAMPDTAKDWFGRQPPDLSLETKARGSDWVYTYLQSFYLDNKRPFGVNNDLLPGLSMPDVLGNLQGWQLKVEVTKAEGDAKGAEESGPMFEVVQPGQMSAEEFKDFSRDLTNFMAYAAEPVKSERIHYGMRVTVYLLVLLAMCMMLKKEFWRDVH
jgi:ubiquinol-cytochrome c reductase cytochrome c1 subunit